MVANIPKTMKALRYEKPETFGIVEVPVPTLRDNDVLVCIQRLRSREAAG